MNVFWLDEDPRLAARYHADQHVSKLLLEAAQVLCTVARESGCTGEFLYRPTHRDHPITRWASASGPNWNRLHDHARALNAEFVERYDHDEPHASWTVTERLDPATLDLPDGSPTPRPQVMPERYRRPSAVDAYRTYYATEKADWLTWRYTPEPPWLDEYRLET